MGVRVTDTSLLEHLEQRLPPASRVSDTPSVEGLFSVLGGSASKKSNVRRYHILYANSVMLARTLNAAEVLDEFESFLHLYVAARSRQKLFVHAGAVGWNGRAILLPGPSHSGKSSLVAELVRRGATYYSDDMVPLDRHGRVHAYPKPLMLRSESGRQRLRPEDLGGVAGRDPLPVGAIVLANYRPGARWRPRKLTPGDAMLSVLSNTVPVRRRAGDSLSILGLAIANASNVWKGARGEAYEMAPALLSKAMSSKEVS